MRASKIVVTEILESRIAQAWKFGADGAINPLSHSANGGGPGVEEAVRQVAEGGGGFNIAFDTTGLQSTLDLCILSAKPCGVIFNVAIHKKALSLNLNDLGMKKKKLMGGICYSPEDFEYVIGLLAEKRLDAEQIVTSVVPLSRAVEGAFELVHSSGAHVKILIKP